MAKQLALRFASAERVTIEHLKKFLEECDSYGLGVRSAVRVELEVSQNGAGDEVDTVKFCVSLPEPKPAGRRVIRLKKKLDTQVTRQIARRKKARERGEQLPGYVPPVKGTVRVRMGLCAVCGGRFRVKKTGRMMPHENDGQKCPGSGRVPKKVK